MRDKYTCVTAGGRSAVSSCGMSKEMPCDGIIPASSAFFVVSSPSPRDSDMVADLFR